METAWKAPGGLRPAELQSGFEAYFLAMGVSGLFIPNSQFTPKIPDLPLDTHNRSEG